MGRRKKGPVSESQLASIEDTTDYTEKTPLLYSHVIKKWKRRREKKLKHDFSDRYKFRHESRSRYENVLCMNKFCLKDPSPGSALCTACERDISNGKLTYGDLFGQEEDGSVLGTRRNKLGID